MTTLAPLLPRKSFLALMRAFTLTAAILIPAFYAHAASYKILYRFQGGNDGWLPYGNLLSDGHGGFYGTTYNGGSTTLCRGNGCGTVFHLTPPTAADAAWAETVLYSFQGGESDGEGPNGNIVIDSDGSLYGATLGGGPANTGVIYKLSPPAQAGGAWSETILHAFTFGSPDGDAPTGGVVWAPSHALYGETNYGGIYRGDCEDTGCGTIYQVAPPAEASGSWSESVLYSFELPQCCGDYGTIVYRDGVLYGSSFYGGSHGDGSVFEMVPPRLGAPWTYADLYSFEPNQGNTDGDEVTSSVIFEDAGNAYSTTITGGTSNFGTLFELVPPGWALDVLYNYTFSGGYSTRAPLTVDAEGNIYGAAGGGGFEGSQECELSGCGTVYKIANVGGVWQETVLHTFIGEQDGLDGYGPGAPLTLEKGVLYGTTQRGGTPTDSEDFGFGTIFAIIP